MQNHFHAIIVAAGSGTRFNSEIPKQYCPLNGKPLIRFCLDTFLSMASCTNLHIVINPSHRHYLSDALASVPSKLADKINIIEGGAERYESVYNALSQIEEVHSTTPVLIHDAARPFVSVSDIEKVVDATTEHGAATLAVNVVDTLRYASQDKIQGTGHPSRDDLWAIQTPQGFTYNLITHAHENAKNDLLGYEGVTDDTSLAQKFGHDVSIVAGNRLNYKITEPEDFLMAEQTLGQNTVTKMATGFDVHAFEEYEVIGNQIKLGGIHIPHKYELKGHSDADVALHALTDALYGLVADGDIGSHFPPSDNAHKNQDSAVFLKAASDAVSKAGGRINHVDLTIICEKPAIGPHRDKMRTNIADLLQIDLGDVSVKATTTEGLGFTGRKEGIAVQAAVTASFTK